MKHVNGTGKGEIDKERKENKSGCSSSKSHSLCMCGYEHEIKDVAYRREFGAKETSLRFNQQYIREDIRT